MFLEIFIPNQLSGRASSSSLRGDARVQLWKVEAAGRLQPWAELGLVTATGNDANGMD